MEIIYWSDYACPYCYIGEANYGYPGGNKTVLVNSIMTKIFTLPADTVLLSGHSSKTTVGDEKKYYGMWGATWIL